MKKLLLCLLFPVWIFAQDREWVSTKEVVSTLQVEMMSFPSEQEGTIPTQDVVAPRPMYYPPPTWNQPVRYYYPQPMPVIYYQPQPYYVAAMQLPYPRQLPQQYVEPTVIIVEVTPTPHSTMLPTNTPTPIVITRTVEKTVERIVRPSIVPLVGAAILVSIPFIAMIFWGVNRLWKK